MEIDEFTDLISKIGFDLVKYYTHLYHQDEVDIPFEEAILNNPEANNIYSSCWFGGAMFEWLFPGETSPTQCLNPMTIVHGFLESKCEMHYFCILNTQEKSVVFNTYGGTPEMLIMEHSLADANELLKDLCKGKVQTLVQLFGITPDYRVIDEKYSELYADFSQKVLEEHLNTPQSVSLLELSLRETRLLIPSVEELKSKLEELRAGIQHPEDQEHLQSLSTVF